MALQFFKCVVKGLKLKVRKFGVLILAFVDVTGVKGLRNRVKRELVNYQTLF